MNTKQEFLAKIREDVNSFLINLGIETPSFDITVPEEGQYGDFTINAAMKYAKELKINPKELAGKIIEEINKNLDKEISKINKIEIAGPGFINIYLNNLNYIGWGKEVLENHNFGRINILNNQKWVVEHTSPNPNKSMHIGHLRNNIVGTSFVRILEACGASVTSEAVMNDRGIAIAKAMYGYKNLKNNNIQECYIYGENKMKGDESIEKEIREMVVLWEKGNKEIRALWQEVLALSYLEMNKTLERIGNKWDKVWYESDHYQEGKDFIAEGLKKNIFKKTEDGAIVSDLEKYKIPDTILLKNDGTSLYITQDIALTSLKKKEYKADKLVWVIGPEQSLAMKQMFAICEQLGIGKVQDYKHLSYGYVGLKSEEGKFQKMSSREGNALLVDEILDAVKVEILEKLKESREELTEEERENLAEKLAVATTKFSFLKSDRNQQISFSIKEASDTKGDSGIYVLYTYARLQSILRQSKIAIDDIKIENNLSNGEIEILKLCLQYEDTLKKSLVDYSAHHLAQYALKLTSLLNAYYAKEKILDSKEEASKLALIKIASKVLKDTLAILGIEVLDKI